MTLSTQDVLGGLDQPAAKLDPITETIDRELLTLGATLKDVSESGSRYYECPGDIVVRVSDHEPNAATAAWIDRRSVLTIRVDLPTWESQLEGIVGHAVAPIITEAPAPGSFQALSKEFVALEKERREHEERLEVIAARLAQLQEPLQDHFADMGIQNMRIDGLTVFAKVDRYVSKRSGVETVQVCRALEECGLGYMVSDGYNAQSLKSKIKEYQENGIEVPEILAELLNIGETVKLATRK